MYRAASKPQIAAINDCDMPDVGISDRNITICAIVVHPPPVHFVCCVDVLIIVPCNIEVVVCAVDYIVGSEDAILGECDVYSMFTAVYNCVAAKVAVWAGIKMNPIPVSGQVVDEQSCVVSVLHKDAIVSAVCDCVSC